MSSDPKTLREASFVLNGLEARLGLILKMIFGTVALIGTLLAGAGALYIQISDLKTDIAKITGSTKAIDDRLARLEKVLEDIRNEQIKTRESIARIDTKILIYENKTPSDATGGISKPK